MTRPEYLLDSNICIYLVKGLVDHARQRVEAAAVGTIVTSVIVYAEVMRGVTTLPTDHQTMVAAFFDRVIPLPFDRAAADLYRTLPFRRHSFDRLIAAHALALGVALVTNNESDFAGVPGLSVENWTVPL